MAQAPEQVLDGLKEFCDTLEDFVPTVPDELTRATLRKSGFDCTDTRTLRLVSVAAQRFVAAVLDEAVNISKRRRLAPAQHLRSEGYNLRDRRLVLTTEDLTEALYDYGITAKPAPYYVDPKRS